MFRNGARISVGTSVYILVCLLSNFITNEDIIYTLDDTDFNKDGTVTYKGIKYARAKAYGRFHYAKANDSIEWLVWSGSGVPHFFQRKFCL